MKKALLSLAVAALFLSALPLAAQTGTWTAVGSTGIIDEASLVLYAFGTTNLTFQVGDMGTIVARYNVTNTFGGGVSDNPPWNTLEMGYFENNTATSVQATLFQVDPCTGAQVALCVVNSVDNASPTCNRCTFAAGTLNFKTKLYYVQATLTRTNSSVAAPSLFTVRIF
jgi:hypothetical protein